MKPDEIAERIMVTTIARSGTPSRQDIAWLHVMPNV
jgi:hypothetical protein